MELPHCTTYSESVVEVEDPAEDVDHVGHEALELVVAAQHLTALLDHDIIRVPQFNYVMDTKFGQFRLRLFIDS